MKILQLIYESFGSPFGFGGAGVRAYKIYNRLKDRHDITLLCMRYPGAKDGEIEGLRHIFIGTESNSLAKSFFAYAIKAAYFVKKYGNEFDIIIENFLPATPFFSRFYTKTPVILHVQGIMERHVLKRFNLIYSIPMYIAERFYPRLYDKFIFVSDVTKKKVMDRIGREHMLCTIIPNASDEELFGVTQEDGDYILFLSRIDIYTKGLDILINAFEKINAEHPEIKLILAGHEFTSFKELVSVCSSSLRDKIEYVGFITGEEKVRLLSKAKMFVLPSRHESSPISILEAAACGKPIIVSNIPELSFVEKNHIGLTFDSGVYESLAEKMIKLLDDERMRKTIGERAREYSKGFRWDRIALRFEEFLNGIVEKSG